MQHTNFDSLLSLVAHDQVMHSLKKSMQTFLDQKEILQKELHSVHDAVQIQKHLVHDAVKEEHIQEQALEDVYVQEDRMQKQLDSAQDYKQFQSFTKELQGIQQEKEKQEQALMQAMNKKLHQEKMLAQLQQTTDDQFAHLQQKIQTLQKQYDAIHLQYEQAAQEREQKCTLVPKEWMEMYTSMSASVHNPIVQIINESCGGCFYPITRVLLQQAIRNKLVQCQNCCRIMYISP
jgi:predicted  nucleic acid-binding Zn-ribbon protein